MGKACHRSAPVHLSDEFSSHVVQTLLIEFPHYCIIALNVALGYAMCCVNVHFIIPANPTSTSASFQWLHPSACLDLSQEFGRNWLNK